MLSLLLKYARGLDARGMYEVTSVLVILGLASFVYQQHVTLVQTRAVYEHPQTKTVLKTRMVKGPVRIVTHYVEGQPVEKIVYRDTVTSESVNAAESAPVPLSETISPRTDRYLVSVGMNRLSRDFDGKALFVGYGWKNRFDLQVGGIKKESISPWLLATLRF